MVTASSRLALRRESSQFLNFRKFTLLAIATVSIDSGRPRLERGSWMRCSPRAMRGSILPGYTCLRLFCQPTVNRASGALGSRFKNGTAEGKFASAMTANSPIGG